MKITDFFKSKDLSNKDKSRPWIPTYRWMSITAFIILVILIIIFFVLNIILKPYMRKLPPEITPWLDKSKKEIRAEQPKQIEQGQQNDAVQS
ncbi:MAG: hypothetical protein LBD46_05960 [Endomicrobium sp.]|jgi:hypothetical protein|nr:hypothetical protein [Endomicrobium sp.]